MCRCLIPSRTLRFQSPLVKPDVQISRIRLPPNPSGLRARQIDASHSDAVEAECFVNARLGVGRAQCFAVRCGTPISQRRDLGRSPSTKLLPQPFQPVTGWFSLSFRLQRGLDVSVHRAVLLDSSSITGTVDPFLSWFGAGLLPSAGVTRPRRSYEPLRHLRSPVLALAGSPLVWRCRSTPRPQTSLVAHCPCPVRAATTTPVGSPAACLARFAGDGGLPRLYGGSAPTLTVSRPARCSLALRPARSADPLSGPFLEVLQTIRRLLIRPECFRLERELAGLGFHQGEQCTLARHTRHHAERAPRHGGRPGLLPLG